MNTARNKPYLSLYWKAAGGLLLVLLILISFFTLFNAEQLTALQTHHRHSNQQQYLVEFDGLMDKSARQLSNLIDSLPKMSGQDRTLAYKIDTHWPSLQITWALESAKLFDEQGVLIQQWGDSKVQPSTATLKKVMHSGSPARELICHQHCRLAVTSPILDNVGQIYLVQLSVSLADTLLDFKQITGSDIGIITTSQEYSNPSVRLGDSGLAVSALTNRSIIQPILFDLSRQNQWRPSLLQEEDKQLQIIDTPFAQHEVKLLVTAELRNNQAAVVFITNTTEAREQIERARNTYIVSGILATIVTTILIILALWNPIIVLRRQARALPLLPEGKFTEARALLKKTTRNLFFTDELSELQKTAVDVTEQLERYQNELTLNSRKLYEMAHFDTLTGLINRAHLTEQIDDLLASNNSADHAFALIYLDLDNFKHINDALGHNFGDQLLVVVAKRLKNCVSGEDLVARLGGDEFCLVLTKTPSQEKAAQVAQRVLATLDQPINIEGRSMQVPTSIGIALAPMDGDTASSLMQHADLAMYKAKAGGKNNYFFFNQDLYKDADTRMALEAELRRAVEEQEFELHYQPQIDLQTGELIGCEALIRWRHPERGLLSPFYFIDALENNGLIITVGKWIIEESCRQRSEWLKMGIDDMKLSINLSVRQFSDPNLVENIERAMQASNIKPSHIELEVTESLLATDIKHATSILSALQQLGISIAIDDFGTGYSSFNYLKQLPLDKLKVDRSFIKDIPDDNDDKQITSAIVAMAHNLGLKVVAEGVETAEQQAYLMSLQCEYAQGFYFDKPMAPDAFLQSKLFIAAQQKAASQSSQIKP